MKFIDIPKISILKFIGFRQQNHSLKCYHSNSVGIAMLIFTLILGNIATAQELKWAKSAGGTGFEEIIGITIDDAGNSFVCGYYEASTTFGATEANETILISPGSSSIFIAKYDENGLLVWAKSAGGSSFDTAEDIALDGTGNIYITGFFSGSATFGLNETNETTLTSLGSDDIFVAKYNGNGELVWATQAGGLNNGFFARDFGTAIAVDDAGNSYITGAFHFTATFGDGEANETNLTSAGSEDAFLAKYDTNGLLQWAKRAGGAGGRFFSDRGKDIAIDDAGNSYVTGYFNGAATFGSGEANATILNSSGSEDIFLAKYDGNGLLQWAKSAGSSAGDMGNSIDIDDNGNSYITGYFSDMATFGSGETNATTLNSAGSFDSYFAKYNGNGLLQWVKQAGGTGLEESAALALDGNENSYITGSFRDVATFGSGEANETMLTATGVSDIYLVKLDKDGVLQWVIGVGNTSFTGGYGIATDADGNIYVVGLYRGADVTFGSGTANETTLSYIGGIDMFIVKYSGGDGGAEAIIGDITNIINDPSVPPAAENDLNDAVNNLQDAVDNINGNDVQEAYKGLEDAAQDLMAALADGADVSELITAIVELALGLAEETVNEADAFAGTTQVDAYIDDANDFFQDYQDELAAGNFGLAIRRLASARKELQRAVHLGSAIAQGMDAEADVQNATTAIQDLIDNGGYSGNANADLQDAIDALNDAIADFNDGEISDGFDDLRTAVEELQDAEADGADATDEIDAIVTLARTIAETKLTEAQEFAGNPATDDRISDAQEDIADAQAEIASGDHDVAVKEYRDAWDDARIALEHARGLRKTGNDRDAVAELPVTYELLQNYPNPFNPSTTIGFRISDVGIVTLKIYDISGRLVKTLLNENRNAGNYSMTWDGTNHLGNRVGSGIYFYKLTTEDFQQVKKMMLIK